MPVNKIPRHIRDLMSHEGKSLQDLKVFHQKILRHKITCGWSIQRKQWIFHQVISESQITELSASTTTLAAYMDDPTQVIQYFRKPNY